MKPKRSNNEGSIHKRKNGTWRAQVTLEGRRISYSGKTKRECQDWIRNMLGEIDSGLTFTSTQLSLEEYMDEWLASKKASVKTSTWTHYVHLARNYVIPSLGKTRIRTLIPNQIQRLYNRLLKEGVGIPTIRKTHTMLRSALNHAIRASLINRNPAKAVIPPELPHKEMNILDENQVYQLLVTAIGHRWETLYLLALTTGMRQMEILGLKWSDIDWSRQTLRIERQLVRPDGTGVKFTAPKTRYGRRVVAVGNKTIDALRTHLEKQEQLRIKMGERWQEYGLVFTTNLGTAISPRNLLRDFYRLLQDAGLPRIRFHDLRHTAASLMLNNGIPVIVVSRRMGHARPSITLDIYGHLIPTMQSEAAQLMDDLVTPIKLHTIAPGCTTLHQD